jgi:hypothetical protein
MNDIFDKYEYEWDSFYCYLPNRDGVVVLKKQTRY